MTTPPNPTTRRNELYALLGDLPDRDRPISDRWIRAEAITWLQRCL